MATFNFPMHRVSTEYPESSNTLKFGGGYQFATKPNAPDQMIFKLSFDGMWYFLNSSNVLDAAVNPTRNMRALEIFYETHRMYEIFVYPHPTRGNQNVRFNKPLIVPEGVINGYGLVQPFGLEFIHQP